jgi:hypothetical protein
MRAGFGATTYSTATTEIVRELSRLGRAYAAAYLEMAASQLYPNRSEDWRDGLGFFLDRVFAHQGTSADFRKIALDAVRDTLRGDLAFGNQEEVRRIGRSLWARFCELGGFEQQTGKGANAKLNPLFLDGPSSRENVVEVCATLPQYQGNVYHMALEELRAGRVRDAHRNLKRIRGVQDKIASLFLRDVAIENESALPRDVVCDPYLQPIDRWVTRVIGRLKGASKLTAAQACIELADAAETSPLLVNAGALYLGAHIAQGMFRLNDALSGASRFREIVVSYAFDLQREGRLLGVLFEANLRKDFLDNLKNIWRRSDLNEEGRWIWRATSLLRIDQAISCYQP